jgi:hypothetical protein
LNDAHLLLLKGVARVRLRAHLARKRQQHDEG